MNHHSHPLRVGRTRVLGLALLLVVAVVAVDLFVLQPASASESAADADIAAAGSPRARYLAEASLFAEKRALASAADEWERAAQHARAVRQELASRVVRAETAQLALESFRQRLLRVASEAEVTGARVTATLGRPADRGSESAGADNGSGGPSLVPLEAKVRLDRATPDEVYRLADRLDHLPNLLAAVDELSITGPGQKAIDKHVSAEIRVRSLAMLERESR